MKSAGYDPDRPWDKEEALFAEAKRDMDRIQAEDRGMIFDENGEMVGEADEGSQMGDETMLDAIDEEGEDEEVVPEGAEAEEMVGDGDTAEAEAGLEGEAENGEVGEEGGGGGNGSLFLPGGVSP